MRILLLFCCFIVNFGAAQEIKHSQLSYRLISPQEGLPSSKVHCLHQDRSGYIWIGTDKGAVRYDSYQFRYFTSQQGLSNNTVFQIKSDYQGNVWLSTFSGGLSYYSPETDKIQPHPLNDSLLYLLKNDWMGAWHIAPNNNIWWTPRNRPFLITNRPSIYELSFEHIHHHQLDYLQLKDDSIKIAIRFFDYSTDVVWSNNTNNGIAPTFFMSAFWHDGQGNIVAVGDKGIHLWHQHIPIARHNEIKEIKGIYRDNKKQFWIYSRYGLYCFKDWNALLNNQYTTLFAQENITDFLEDNEGNYWIASLDKGIYFVPVSHLQQFNLETIITDIDSFDGKLWLASQSGALHYIENKKSISLNASPQSYLRAIVPMPNKGFYMTNNFIFNPQQSSFISFYNAEPSGYVNSMKSFCRSKDGKLWIGHIKGISCIHNDQVIFKSNTDIGFEQWVNALCEDDNGQLWIGSPKGLFSFDPSSRAIIAWGEKFAPLAQSITALSYDHQGFLWVATYSNGVFKREKDGSWQRFSFPQSIYPIFVNTMLTDAIHGVWLGTNNGVYQLQNQQDSLFRQVLSHQTGLLSNEVNCFWLDTTQLWVGTDKGVSVVPLRSFSEQSDYIPAFYITKLSVPSDTAWFSPKTCTLQWNQSSFHIHWSYISFKQHNRLFRYRLRDIDKQWSISQQHEIQYTRLAAGEYEWELGVLLPNGKWYDLPQTLKIVILPHWSETWLFKLSVMMLVLFFLGGWIYIRWSAAKRRREMLVQIQELEYKALRSQMNPHFIFNTLNSILYFINSDHKKSASLYLTDFSQLMRLVLEHSKQHFIPLQEDWNALRIYTKLEQVRLSDKIKVHFPNGDIPEDISFNIPPMLLQPLVENAFVHAFSGKEQGNLYIRWRVVDNSNEGLCFEIEDDGIGRQAAAKNRRQAGSPTGLLNLQARLAHINTLYKSNFSLVFIDLLDDNGQACGTKVCLQAFSL